MEPWDPWADPADVADPTRATSGPRDPRPSVAGEVDNGAKDGQNRWFIMVNGKLMVNG
jgi:hypothetical protein